MFESTLKQLVDKVDGAQGAAVLNLDGLIIEAVDGAGEAVATTRSTPQPEAPPKTPEPIRMPTS